MTKSKPVSINGDTRKFAISDEIKRYSMIDLGFKETNNKNFLYDHPLYNESPYNATMKFKVTVNAEMNHLTMVITDKTGLQKVNIFKNENLKPARELLEYMLRDLMEKQVIEEV
ncbi:hypothetical protein FC62_GL000306 [Amylolactobacillus amylotrophicus DSM 20534]|uniref:Uncharacterized protein n=3 Tax=Amylolactobacillus TaxID=2767876 RepID=A0A0R1YKD5_9LACO|nr:MULTISPECIES: hypothetical protein [Amylolactobacillus]APT19115.1 hypothetical protein LA20533_07585 [Amylolactobacillus amylophilus DSM 20533 = JCM 1125]KRK38619.1 hypothetical protein FC62_GL000306 [Amylolactobacillus amylotrophicus DSM 20534]KRM42738.1 hypothetical protein FD40_GL000533 [Amylolactobacillus amylophilus DSM 20533 = JCM 1125]GED79601.1 hypothetical protein LAM01_00740 [Amylolactobacillus amylophilus]